MSFFPEEASEVGTPISSTSEAKKKKAKTKKPLSNKARNALHYARFLARQDITVKHVKADLGQKRSIFVALHETYNILGFGDKVGIGVVMCMTQESDCRDLEGGDEDSVGAFQQRDAWGSYAERHNVASACKMFLTGGHEGQRGWQQWFGKTAPTDRSLGQAVQDIQVSAFPTAYAQWESEATSTVARWMATRVK